MNENFRVLIVDDHKFDRIIARAALSKLGIKHITEAENGSIAESKLLTSAEMGKSFDLAIIDWNMPMNNGLTLLKHIRSNSKLKFCKVIIMTASSEKKIVEEAINNGVDEFIVKPIALETLRQKIEKLFA